MSSPGGFIIPGPFFEKVQNHPRRAVRSLAVAFVAWQVAAPALQRYQAWRRGQRTFTITVPGTDDVYDDLHEWVLSIIPDDARRALVANTGGDRRDDDRIYKAGNEPSSPGKFVRLQYDGDRTHKIKLDGQAIEVRVDRNESAQGGRFSDLPWNWRRQLERIIFTATSPEGRDAIVTKVEELSRRRAGSVEPRPPLYIANRWGSGWDRRDDLPRRTLESVILREGQLEEIVSDLQRFLDSEEEYERRTLPWHRGYLFHGPPGTGKTSLVKALAEHFKLPLYYVPLADIERDGDLVSLVANISPRSILLLEDVDVFHATRERDDDSPGVTLSAMLNALDGIWTPHGLITFMTTNHRHVLDDAIVRPGRVDVEAHLDMLTAEQARRFAEWYTGSKYGWGLPMWRQWAGSSPADFLQALVANGEPVEPDIIDAEIVCCDLHNRNCEDPEEVCCEDCPIYATRRRASGVA